MDRGTVTHVLGSLSLEGREVVGVHARREAVSLGADVEVHVDSREKRE